MSIPVKAHELTEAQSNAEFPSEGAIVLRTMPTVALQDPADIARAMGQFDEQVFLAELMGEAIQAWFYDFKVAGKKVEGVSAQGAHEFARIRADQGYAIRFPADQVTVDEVTELGERGIRAVVIARDARTGQEGIGMAFYPHYAARQNGDKEFDRFAGRKALSVAERNAILRLIPEATILGVLKERDKVIGENARRNQAAGEAVLANRPQAKRLDAGESRAQAERHDPYAVSGVPGKRQATGQGRFIMPFGPSKGTMLADMPEKELRGALMWATDKMKFDEFREAATEFLNDIDEQNRPL